MLESAGRVEVNGVRSGAEANAEIVEKAECKLSKRIADTAAGPRDSGQAGARRGQEDPVLKRTGIHW